MMTVICMTKIDLFLFFVKCEVINAETDLHKKAGFFLCIKFWCTCTHSYMCICKCVYIYVCTSSGSLGGYIFVCRNVYFWNLLFFTCVDVCVFVFVCLFVYVYVCMFLFINFYARMSYNKDQYIKDIKET